MGKPKSLTRSMVVDSAKRQHNCQHNSRHVVAAGDLRLKVASGRSHEHYCLDCATRFIDLSIAHLQGLRASLNATASAEDRPPAIETS